MKIPFLNIKIERDKSSKKGVYHSDLVAISGQDEKRLAAFLNRIKRGTRVFSPTHENFVKEGFCSNTDVFSVVNDIAKTASTLPKGVRDIRTKEPIDDTPFHEYMARPNVEKMLTWEDLNYQQIVWLLITGNSFLINQESFGMNAITSDIGPTPFVDIIINQDDYFDPVNHYLLNMSRQYRFEKEEMMHVKFYNPCDFADLKAAQYGMSPLMAARFVTQTGNDRWEANASVLQNKGMIGVLTDKSEYPMTNEEYEQYQEKGLERIGGAGKFGQVYFSRKNLDFVQMAMSTVDLQLLETGPVTLRALCNQYGVDSSIYNDPQNKTFNNRTEAEKSYYTKGIMPINKKFDAGYTMNVLPKVMKNSSRYEVYTDYSKVEALQKDKLNEAKYWEILVKTGVQSATQAAIALGHDEPDETAKALIGGSSNTNNNEPEEQQT